jgi:serine/threonine protein kinase
MVQELCHGGTLQSWIYEGKANTAWRLSPTAVNPNPLAAGSYFLTHVSIELFDALDFLRAQGFVHSDLKPDNCGMTRLPHEVISGYGPQGMPIEDPAFRGVTLLKLIDFGCTQEMQRHGGKSAKYSSISKSRGAEA